MTITTTTTHRALITAALAVTAAAVALCGLSPRLAQADTADLSIGTSNRYMHSSSIDTVSADDSLVMFSMDLGWRLNRVRIPWIKLELDAGFTAGGLAGQSFQRLTSETSIVSGMLGVRGRWELDGTTSFFARARIGMTQVSLELRDSDTAMPYLADDRLSASTYLGAGTDIIGLRSMRDGRERFGVGLRFEGGYFASSPVTMRAVSRGANSAEDAILIPTRNTKLGSLNVSAWVARFAIVARY